MHMLNCFKSMHMLNSLEVYTCSTGSMLMLNCKH